MTLFISFSYFILNIFSGNYQLENKLNIEHLPKQTDDSLQLEKYKGKVVVLNFWASWSKASRLENKNLVRIYQKYKTNSKVVFVSVSLDTDVSSWKSAIDEDDLAWKHHYCDFLKYESPIAKKYQITSLPIICIFDKSGKMVNTASKVQDLESFIDGLAKS